MGGEATYKRPRTEKGRGGMRFCSNGNELWRSIHPLSTKDGNVSGRITW